MNPEKKNKSNPVKKFAKLPFWLQVIILLTIISWGISGFVWIFSNIKAIALGKTETQLDLQVYESEYNDFQIELPKSFPPPYESRDGIHGDPDLILEFIEGDSSQAIYEIARVKLLDSGLPAVVDWEKKRALRIKDIRIDSIDQLDSSNYPGSLIIYTVPKGFYNEDAKCHLWVTYIKPYGYVISICTASSDWNRLAVPFKKIIESFYVK